MNLKQFLSKIYVVVAFLLLPFSLTAEESSTQSIQNQLEEQFGQDSTVLTSYRRLMDVIGTKVSDKEREKILQAVLFAAKTHQDKTRKHEPVPYLCYPLDVAYDMAKIAGIYESEPLIAAILHDTLRENDQASILKAIEKQFGSSMAKLVKELGDYPVSTKEKQQHLLMAHATQENKVVAEVQLANLLYNLEELVNSPPPQWTQEKKDHYVQFAHAFVERLRHNANPALTQAVEKQISTYWDAQSNHTK